MNIEHVHEDADLEGLAIQVRIDGFLDHYDATIGGRDNALGSATGNRPARIAEKLNTEDENDPEG